MLWSWIVKIALWALAGFVADKLMNGKPEGLLWNIVLGFVGGLVGSLSSGSGSAWISLEGCSSTVDVYGGSYVGGLVVAFLLILIALVAIGNVGNLSFRLPNLELLDEIGGAVLGFIKGMFYCVLLCWLLSFFGILIGKDTLGSTTLARFFLAFRFITNSLL